ncbi:hypothetical protein HMPREF0972_01435 [Actinomyces sp. oral taxon 848 str. F0332]|nr:hypothetical protein HMPREF0972_01435 [Actinomyces sp. oral taxon 848 str. F0332]
MRSPLQRFLGVDIGSSASTSTRRAACVFAVSAFRLMTDAHFGA